MTIVETTVWIDFINGSDKPHAVWLERNRSQAGLGVIDLIFCEVLQGFRDEKLFRDVRNELLKLGVHSSGGAELALASAQNYRFLRARGITVRKTIDCLIATYCIRGGHTLLHNDRDFDPFEEHLGLSVIHP